MLDRKKQCKGFEIQLHIILICCENVVPGEQKNANFKNAIFVENINADVYIKKS